MTDKNHIGIFDSGIGGLSVANAVLSAIPGARITYYGDNAWFPFGEKTEDVIGERLKKGLDFLLSSDCGIIVIACNTASIVAERQGICSGEEAEIIPVTRPVIEKLLELDISSLSIIATNFTIHSGFYEEALRGHPGLKTIKTFARPDLVRMVEYAEDPDMVELDNYHETVDAVLLGCTHYHFLKRSLKRQLPGSTLLLDSADLASEALLLEHISLEKTDPAPMPRIRFVFTDPTHQPRWPMQVEAVWGAEFGLPVDKLK